MRFIALAVVLAAVAGCALTPEQAQQVAHGAEAASASLDAVDPYVSGQTGMWVAIASGIASTIATGFGSYKAGQRNQAKKGKAKS